MKRFNFISLPSDNLTGLIPFLFMFLLLSFGFKNIKLIPLARITQYSQKFIQLEINLLRVISIL